MKTYALNDANMVLAQTVRPQVERFFYDGNIYVVEGSSDYSGLPAEILALLNGRQSTTPLRSSGYYPLYNRGEAQARYILHPQTELNTRWIESNGTAANGQSISVGKAGRVYSNPDAIVSRVEVTDLKVAGGFRGEIIQAKNYLVFGTTYNVGLAVKLAAWDFVNAPDSEIVIFQIHQSEDVGDFSGIPPFFLCVTGSTFTVNHTYATAPINTTSPRRSILCTLPASADTWYYFTFRINFNPTGIGTLDVYLNGVLMGSYSGPLGYNDLRGPYTKVGCYKAGNFPPGIASREVHYKGCIVIPATSDYTLPQIYKDLQAIN